MDGRGPRTTLKSYMLQEEAEAASREAKIRWCEQAGVRVVSLQHDGIVAIVGAGEESDRGQPRAWPRSRRQHADTA